MFFEASSSRIAFDRKPLDFLRYSVSVFGKNLTNDPYHDFGVRIFGNDLDWNAGPPRRFGVEVAFTY